MSYNLASFSELYTVQILIKHMEYEHYHGYSIEDTAEGGGGGVYKL
jgi:hypothetical protein